MRVLPPNRTRHAYTQSLVAPPDRVFPLLCPVREVDWVPGWMPDLVLSASGVAEPECVFVMPGEPAQAIWIITHHDPIEYEVVMYKVTPGHTVGKLEIALVSDGRTGTRATIAYTFTSLGPAGDAFLETFTEDWYRHFMETWERALNHYLTTGQCLTL